MHGMYSEMTGEAGASRRRLFSIKLTMEVFSEQIISFVARVQRPVCYIYPAPYDQ